MFVDTFTYFNEKELLELRVNALKDHVDGFIIAEGDRTHRGDPKSFTLKETITELGLPSDLIQVLEVKLPSQEETVDPWVRERGQRDALTTALEYLPDDTIFICSDCDELPNWECFDDLKAALKQVPTRIFGLNMSMHYGRADLQLFSPEGELFEWRCATVCTVETLKTYGSLTRVREQPNRKFIGCRDAGWHFSWMGTSDQRAQKLSSIAEHYIWDCPEVQALCASFVPQEGATDMLGRKDHLLTRYPIEDLPEEAVKLDRVKRYLLPDGR
jgi:beta-1,4-mannosyl-glycoprotein beta-1,4-N-acetylglucosaminyltransferase